MKLTLGKKLGVGFGVILALMIFSAIVVYLKAGRITRCQAAAFEDSISQSRHKSTAGPESDPGQRSLRHSGRNPTFKAGRN
jgi:hypothetical protein